MESSLFLFSFSFFSYFTKTHVVFCQSQYNPSIPPYYISDAASVSVTEIRQQTQRQLIKEGFNSLSVSGSLYVLHSTDWILIE